MRSEEGVLSIPFRLAISIIVLSLALPICLSSMEQGNIDVSRNLAYKLSGRIAETIASVSSGGLGESVTLDFIENIRMLRADIEIRIGDYPGGKNSSLIICSDSGNWQRTIALQLGNDIDGVCSPNLSSFVMTKNCDCLIISRRSIEFFDIVVLEEK